jgi:hypothetical protein
VNSPSRGLEKRGYVTLRMNSRMLIVKRIFLLLSAAVCAIPMLAQDDDGIHWLGNYQEALREAKRTRKPIFLEFRCEA